MFTKLFEPGNIGTMQLRNRIVMPPMYTGMAEGNYATDRLIDYLAARARGGAGLVICELSIVDPLGQFYAGQPALWDDKYIPRLSKMADAIHQYGAKAGIQIGHGGNRATSVITGGQPVSASPIAGIFGELPRELTIDEIKHIVDAFVQAAHRVKQAGIDGVEIHCAHGYLLRQFLSSYSNKRTDEYGGDLRGRAKFAIEVMQSVRQAMGDDYPVWFRINGRDYVNEGEFTLEESKMVSGWLVEAGANAVSVSASTYESKISWSISPMFLPQGVLLPLAEEIKKAVNVPVIAASRINTAEFAEQTLKSGKADFIAMGRTLIADPDLPYKAKEGRVKEIRRCLSCNQCIDRPRPEDAPYLICTVNAAVGKEKEYEIKPAAKPKKVMVIGGGPGGMEAARVATLMGHKVTLYEKEDHLGGQIEVASKGPFKDILNTINEYFSYQFEILGVDVKLNNTVTADMVSTENPDVVIISTGAVPMIPPIPGVDRENVFTACDVLLEKAQTGNRVVVIGGGSVGLEVAETLKEKGKEVIVIEMLKRVGADLGLSFRGPTLDRMRKSGVEIHVLTKAKEIRQGMLIAEEDGKEVIYKCDTVVLATGSRPANGLVSALEGRPNVYKIGDCVKPRNILDAIAEAARIARQI